MFQLLRNSLSCFLVVLAGASLPLVGKELSAEDRNFFEGSVRPLLVARCYECHSEKAGKTKGGLLLDRRAGWESGGDSGGSVLNLEKPGESLLIKMVHHDPDFEAMPPKDKLSDEEISVLEEWVKRGAPDPRDEAIGEAVSDNDFDLEARSHWWSLQPLAKVSVPLVKDETWPVTESDRFVLAKLEENGWEPAEDADKAALLRRASVTLTGLAPSVEELERFLKDTRGDAYEREVDRLLASPHFGERFARHWMDVVRYADSKAFEQDYTIPYGNEYRDYLIRAFNEDVPFDQFVREAFAGDLLENPRINSEIGVNESVIGPGFILSTDGQHGPPDIHEDEARIFDGMINTATVAFQSLTVSCAKCHDHKFDAITAADYYSFYGMLRSSRLHYANANSLSDQGEEALEELKELKPKVVSAILNESLANSDDLAEVIGTALELRQDGELAALLEQSRKDKSKRAGLRTRVLEMAASRLSVDDASSVVDWFEFLWFDEDIGELNGLRRALIGEATKRGNSGIASFKLDERFKWKAQGDGFALIEDPDFILDLESPSIIRSGLTAGASSGLTASRLDGVLRSADFVLDGKPIELWAKGRGATVQMIVRNYELVGKGPTTGVLQVVLNSDFLTRVRFPTTLWEGESAYLEVLHHGPEMGCIPATATISQPSDQAYAVIMEEVDFGYFDGYWSAGDRGSVAEQILLLLADAASGQSKKFDTELLGALFSAGLVKPDRHSPELRQEIERMKSLQGGLPRPRYVRTLTEGTPYDEPVYVRGNHKQPSKEANPKHYLDVFGGPRIGAEGSGRLEYAEHLLTTSDFLTARVRVNRIWSRIFGNGLVASVDDFGKMGSKPSHPELLDYLARRFIDEGWSTKRLIRELMVSRTYRMSSVPDEEVLELDPNNALLQHMPLQRMDAESLRDHILHVSGELKLDLYGPCVDVNTDDQLPSRAMPRNGPLDGAGRRSIYQSMRRSYLPGFLKAFNLPDPVAPAGARQVTNVPAQSLALLNHPFVHQQAEAWAKSLMVLPDDEARIERMHLQAFSRVPTDEEKRWARRVLREFKEDGGEKGAWFSLCHLMMNRKEFLYVF